MRRPQFTLKSLLWLMALVGSFFAGRRWERAQRAADAAQARKELSTITQADDGSWVGYTLYDDGTFDKKSLPPCAVFSSTPASKAQSPETQE